MRYKIILFMALMACISCDTWPEDININPNAPNGLLETESDSDVDPSVFMIPMLWSTVSGFDYLAWNVIPAVCEYHGKTKSLSQGNRHKSWHAFDDSGFWVPMYSSIRVVKNLRNAALKAQDVRYEAIADIWESYTFSMITNLYGDVPYFDPISEQPPLLSTYDPQSEIYPAILAKLKDAGEALNRSDVPINQSNDLVFGGDILKWKKFANMLRIRLGMYMADAAPEEAKSILQEILSDTENYPIMESNDDNASFKNDGVERPSVLYNISKAKIEEAPFSNVFIERLISLNDPRLPIIAKPVRKVHTDPTTHVLPSNPGEVKYAGHLYGITTDNAHAAQWNGGFPFASALGDFFRKEDVTGQPLLESASTPTLIALYSEQEFFIAEAIERGMVAGDAQMHYENAIEASFNFYGADFTGSGYQGAYGSQGVAGLAEYLSQPDVDYNGGRDKLTLIAEQKWLASFFLGLEPYFDHRRTMLPEMRASSGAENFGPNGSGSKFPSRAAYSDSETANNPGNVSLARSNGFDVPITTDESRNEAKMWIIRNNDLQMPIFQEPIYSSEYPVIASVPGSGTDFLSWYNDHWDSMFWWK
ncbi:SusD/RagB family nutrient-binding outer membrane lipoprotein [Portibacter marinus]|uniref:SusD/RagB family nutrient-binding outer membrane lipoprotein n=1 Tax=Portibacter marinus TaxID=2898660 RepID=UPI001F1F26E8|nr:SusD/RagB family nutrient-binding outer membrane lipoprotein [Portibacter marinus]